MNIVAAPSKKIALVVALLLAAFGAMVLGYKLLQRGGTRTSLGSLLNTEDNLAPNPPATSSEVAITKDGFSPATVQITKGLQVTWTNTDDKPHRIAADPYPSVSGQTMFDSEALAPGDTFSFVFSDEGTFTYYDDTDPLQIKGTILVKQ